MSNDAAMQDKSAGPNVSFVERLGAVAKDIKLSHSIFALPFALLATLLAPVSVAPPNLPSMVTIGLIVLCMILARTAAMTFNRWADRSLDASNPRTQGRAIPSGRLNANFVLVTCIGCSLAFIAAAAGFWFMNENPWPLILSPFVIVWLCLYSLTKRFTWLCHLFLGSALAISPVAACIAVEPPFLERAEPWLLAGMVMCWVAGFDIIYALQDISHDTGTGLYSMPSRLGVEPALWVSRLLHGLAMTALVMMVLQSDVLGIFFTMGVGMVAALLVLEHVLIIRSPQRHINMAFFTVNGVISVILGGAGIVDVIRAT